MKRNLFFAMLVAAAAMTTGCSQDDDLTPPETRHKDDTTRGEKTVLIYMAGRNDLNDELNADLSEIKAGSRRITDAQNLIVFVRRYDDDQEPWLARIRGGQVTDSVSLSDMGVGSSDGQMRACDPKVMEGVMRYAFSHYPAATGDYGLVLWGHGSGWLMQQEVSQLYTRAFGVDYGQYAGSTDRRVINIPTVERILRGLPHLKFIMADCCNFMCLENLYELRNVCDYIIGSPAEIPGEGAPYDEIVPDMFAAGKFYASIIDKYYSSVHGFLPLTAVRTSAMENVAQATRTTLQAVKDSIDTTYPDMTGVIHYYYTDERMQFFPEFNIFYDAGDFIRRYATEDVYQQWRQALDQAIVERRMATMWSTDKIWRIMYSDFTVTPETFHGVSMFVPQNPARGEYAGYNENICNTAWWKVVNP